MSEDKKLDSLLERVYQDGVEKSNKKADEIISNAKISPFFKVMRAGIL